MSKRAHRTYTDEFKAQVVQLYLNGKPRIDIIREYDLTPSALGRWINQSRAIATIPADLRRVGMFHTDRGSEFNNKLVSETLRSFGIRRSLSDKGCPYDNAVSEATYKVLKIEVVKKQTFPNLTVLDRELRDYIHWFNNIRMHGTLGYLTPKEYKKRDLLKFNL